MGFEDYTDKCAGLYTYLCKLVQFWGCFCSRAEMKMQAGQRFGRNGGEIWKCSGKIFAVEQFGEAREGEICVFLMVWICYVFVKSVELSILNLLYLYKF